MVTEVVEGAQPRIPLSRDRVLRAAVALADRGGIGALTMRHLAEELGVEAMSLYYHVANKEALLDGVVEVVVEEIDESVKAAGGPPPAEDWKTAMRTRILAARTVLLRHRWAPTVLESRVTMSPRVVRYFDGVLGILIEGGFTYDLAHHAMHALGSRALGFTQEMFEPDEPGPADDAAAEAMLAEMADQVPYIIGMMMEISHDDPDTTLGWCDDQVEFEFGLDLILDGLERLRPAR
jgi:AcrR family transcriptional regulator